MAVTPADNRGGTLDSVGHAMTNQAAGENPLKVFGAMLAYYRTRAG